ncbi:MAG: PAS domain S-box protein [Calditrichales bacterium]|nr:PAS domain S-box protein [Calditrichales bacterium]
MIIKKSKKEQKQAQTDTGKNDGQFSSINIDILDNSEVGIFVLNSGFKIVWANQAVESFFGLKRENLIGKNKRDLICTGMKNILEDSSTFAEKAAAGYNKKTGAKKIECHVLPGENREERWLAYQSQPIPSSSRAGGRVEYYFDITSRVQTREALQDSEDRYRRLVELNPEAIAVHCQGKIVYANKACLKLMGVSKKKDIIGKKVLDFVHPDYLKVVMTRIQRSQRKKKYAEPIEEKFIRLDGKIIDVEVTAIPFAYEGNPATQVVFRNITEYKQAECKLKHSQKQLDSIVKSIPDIIYRLDPKGKITFISETIKKYGYTPEELTGKNIFALVHPEDREKSKYRVNERRTGERRTRSFEVRFVTKDDKPIPFDIHSKDILMEPVFILEAEGLYSEDESGKTNLLGSQGVARDVTERKKYEADLLESKERYRTLFEFANDAIFLMDGHNFVECNIKGMEMFGCLSEQIIHKSPFDLSPEKQPDGKNSKEKAYKIIDKAFKGEPQLFEWQHCRHDGATFDAEVNINKIELAGKQHLLIAIRDITKRKLVEKEISMLAHAVMSISECVDVTDMDGKIIFINDAFLNTYGYNRKELMGKPISIIRSPRNSPDAINAVLHATLQGGWQGESINKRKDGSDFPVLLSTSVIKDERGNPFALIGVGRDITERKHLETQLQQSQKMEAIGSLAGGVAHDFNNLLTIIRGYSKLILSRLDKDNPLYKNITQIDKAGEHAESLTNQLLAFSRKQILQPKVVALNELISELEKMVGRLIGENIELSVSLDPELGYIKADPHQIEQVIMNLVVNARDAMPEGGKATIETKNVVLNKKYALKHRIEETGPYVMLAISDSGVGMDKNTQTHLFEPFFTTKEKGKGTGLGLATVYGIIKQSGGYIWVYSEPGLGTTFKIYLPRIDEELISSDKSEEIFDDNLKGTETILVVEDEDEVRNLVCEMLQINGYNILEASNGENALSICEQYKEPIHLVLTDIVMPKMSGHDLVARLLHIQPQMKILYMSGYTDIALVHKGMLDSDIKFIQKPFTPLDLARKIRGILDTN